jgi:plastocyanin
LKIAHSLAVIILASLNVQNGTAENVAPSTQAPIERKISIGNFKFSPSVIEVPAGTTVLWINEDDVPHIVIGTDVGSPLKSPPLDTDDRYSAVLDKPGTYKYFCSLHPHMIGTVIVK